MAGSRGQGGDADAPRIYRETRGEGVRCSAAGGDEEESGKESMECSAGL
jgi:hypothetical protein